MQSTIETRVVKVGDFVIIKEEYILYKGNPFEHVFIFTVHPAKEITLSFTLINLCLRIFLLKFD